MELVKSFKSCRDFTKKEAKLYKNSINKLFRKTNKKLYDLGD